MPPATMPFRYLFQQTAFHRVYQTKAPSFSFADEHLFTLLNSDFRLDYANSRRLLCIQSQSAAALSLLISIERIEIK